MPVPWWKQFFQRTGFHVYHIAAFFAVAALGVGCSLLPYFLLHNSQYDNMYANLRSDADTLQFGCDSVVRETSGQLSLYQSLIISNLLFNVSNYEENALRLSTYLDYTQDGLSYLQLTAVLYAGVVTPDVRTLIENITGVLHITERLPDGEYVPARYKSLYYPVLYMDSFEKGLNDSSSLGFDLSSLPAVLLALQTSAAAGQIISTTGQSDQLPFFTSNQKGILIISPVFDSFIPPADQQERINSVRGFVIALADMITVVNSVITEQATYNLNVYLYDDSEPPPYSVLYPLATNYANSSQVKRNLGRIERRSIELTNWTLVVTPTQKYQDKYTNALPIVVLIMILVFTVFIIFYMGDQIRKRGTIRRMHEEKQSILNTLLPPEISSRLVAGETVIADGCDDACVMFMDIAGFTDFSSHEPPANVVNMLNMLFSEIDQLCGKYNVEKIKTIGDCYMAANGIFPRQQNLRHNVTNMLDFSLSVLDVATRVFALEDNTRHLKVRIGVHSGSVISGVICASYKPHFDIWGDTVNVASRMESTGIPSRIQVSSAIAELVDDDYIFNRTPELVNVKGKGLMQTWFLEGKKELKGSQVIYNSSANLLSPPLVVPAQSTASLSPSSRNPEV